MRWLRLIPFLIAPALMVASPADAQTFYGPSPYLQASDSPFASLSFSPGYFHVETFEDGALNVPGVTASNGSVNGPHAAADSVDADDGLINGSGAAGRSWWGNFGNQAVTFSFSSEVLGGLPTHVGCVWTDAASPEFDDVTLEGFDALGASLGTVTGVQLGDGSYSGGTPEDRFLGISWSGGISKIEIRMASSGDWELDHLQYGRVQEVAVHHGSGFPGAGGFVPVLDVYGVFTPAGSVILKCTNGLGGGSAFLFVGIATASIPMSHGVQLLVAPPLIGPIGPLPLQGVGPGNGILLAPAHLPAALPIPVPVVIQSFIPDAGAPLGLASSNGVSFTIHQ